MGFFCLFFSPYIQFESNRDINIVIHSAETQRNVSDIILKTHFLPSNAKYYRKKSDQFNMGDFNSSNSQNGD